MREQEGARPSPSGHDGDRPGRPDIARHGLRRVPEGFSSVSLAPMDCNGPEGIRFPQEFQHADARLEAPWLPQSIQEKREGGPPCDGPVVGQEPRTLAESRDLENMHWPLHENAQGRMCSTQDYDERDDGAEEQHQNRENLTVRFRNGILDCDLVQPLLKHERDVLVSDLLDGDPEFPRERLNLAGSLRPRRWLLWTARLVGFRHWARYPRRWLDASRRSTGTGQTSPTQLRWSSRPIRQIPPNSSERTEGFQSLQVPWGRMVEGDAYIELRQCQRKKVSMFVRRRAPRHRSWGKTAIGAFSWPRFAHNHLPEPSGVRGPENNGGRAT